MPEEREDVKTTLEQGTTPDASQQKRKWRSIDRIAGTTLAAEVLMSFIWAILWVHECRFEHQLQMYFALVLIILTGGYLALIFCPIFKKDNDPRWFHARILSSGIVGGSYAFLLPAVMSLEEGSVTSGGAAALRQAILLATGGLIGLIALGETRRKNDNDREAAENLRIHQQDTLDQQKDQFEKQLEKQQEQFDANAFKDRKAERRERYTKAVEQLGDEKAPVRMGGVYTLVGLVDEWLEEEKLSKHERVKEGQVIINNLCAYIRSPFTLASQHGTLSQNEPKSKNKFKKFIRKYIQRDFYINKANFQAEADVRLSIIKEIHDRLQDPDKNTPGAWSDFEYDFSRSTFFYPVDLTKSYYKQPVNFSGSTYHDWADFRGLTYQGVADFSGSTYQGVADFSGSTYQDWADFRGSTYQDWAVFSDSTYETAVFSDSTYETAVFSSSTYQDGAFFGGSTYQGKADFRSSIYQGKASFRGSTYTGRADFSGSIYQGEANFRGSTYTGRADFHASTYKTADFRDSTYETADFRDSTYQGEASFDSSIYKGAASFSGSIYKGPANFHGSTYEDETDFSGSIFYQEIYFGKNGDNGSFSRFTDCAPQFYDKTNRKNTLFGSHNNNFTVNTNEGYPINLNSDDLPLDCKFLTLDQKKYFADRFHELEKISNKFFEVKDSEDNVNLTITLLHLRHEIIDWREEATTVKVEDVIAEDTES